MGANDVQGYEHSSTKTNFHESLNKFDFIMDILKQGGADSCSNDVDESDDKSESETIKPKSDSEEDKPKSESEEDKPEKPAKKCPPKGWGGNCPWPPTNGAHCCSEWGWPGVSETHCKHADAVAEGCCTKDASGTLN